MTGDGSDSGGDTAFVERIRVEGDADPALDPFDADALAAAFFRRARAKARSDCRWWWPMRRLSNRSPEATGCSSPDSFR